MNILFLVDEQVEELQSMGQDYQKRLNIVTMDEIDIAMEAILERNFQLIVIITYGLSVPVHWQVDRIQNIAKCPTMIITKASEISIHLLLNYIESLESINQNKTKNAILEKSLPYIEKHLFEEDLTLQKVASNAFVSTCHFSRLFQKHIGTGFKEYVINKRINRAKILLENGEPVTSVCYSVGYNDLTHFARIFKRIVGVNPSVYKQKAIANQS